MTPLKFQIKDGIATHSFIHGEYGFNFLVSELFDLYWLRLQVANNAEILIDVDLGNYSNIDTARLAAWIIKRFILNSDVTSIINTIRNEEIIKNLKGRH